MASGDQPSEQRFSSLTADYVEERDVCTRRQQSQKVSIRKRHQLVIIPTSVSSPSDRTSLSNLVVQTITGNRNQNTCQTCGNVMERQSACSFLPPILCIGLTTVAGSMITDKVTVEHCYSFQIDTQLSLLGIHESREYVLAAAIYNIGHHYSACCLQTTLSRLSYHYYDSGKKSLSTVKLTSDHCLPQEANRTPRTLEAILYVRRDLLIFTSWGPPSLAVQ